MPIPSLRHIDKPTVSIIKGSSVNVKWETRERWGIAPYHPILIKTFFIRFFNIKRLWAIIRKQDNFNWGEDRVKDIVKEKIMLIDGNSLLFRAFYALPLLHNSEGVYTNAVYGFLTMLRRLLTDTDPTHVVVAFDRSRESFRNEIYAEYKGTRGETPGELIGQFKLVREVLELLNIKYIEMDGYEADDIIGTLSYKADKEGKECIIVTGDRDALQLVSPNTRLYLNRKGITEMDIYEPETVKEKCGVNPEQIVELKALMGDASDNIPGVPGIGPKTATKLLNEYPSLEDIYAHLSSVKGKKLQVTLEENKEKAFLSRKLATIIRDIDLACDWQDFVRKPPRHEELMDFYRRMGFNKFLAADASSPEIEEKSKSVPETPFKVLNNLQEWEEFWSNDSGSIETAVYIDASYHHPMKAEIESIWLEKAEKVACINMKADWYKQVLADWLGDEKYPKYLYNAKFTQVLLKRWGIQLRGVKGDLMLLTYVLDSAFAGEDLSSTMAYHLRDQGFDSHPAGMIVRLRKVYKELYAGLSPEQQKLLDDMEMPVSGILAEMEYNGVCIDPEVLKILSQDLQIRLMRDEEEIYRLAGQKFNINSPKQLGKVLFEDLHLPVIKKTKSGYATGAEILEKLEGEHEIIKHIQDYRVLSKLKSTYLDALPNLINPETGRVHSIFKQALTATGRLSSVEPNLQNIPIKIEEGRKIRQAFIAGGAGRVILAADYSQIDLRVLAHISSDENLIDTFRQGIDIHTRTAAEIFGVPLEDVDEDLRRRAKAVNFGIIYGISDFGLARDTGVSRKEAARYIEGYLRSYPRVQDYMHDVVVWGQKHGYVETAFGRRRYLPDLNSRNKMKQSFARRMALNTPIQGTSADIIKLAMIKIGQALKQQGIKAQLILQVHDELLFEVKEEKLQVLASLVKENMEKACELKVPLLASLKYGRNWYEMQPLRLGD